MKPELFPAYLSQKLIVSVPPKFGSAAGIRNHGIFTYCRFAVNSIPASSVSHFGKLSEDGVGFDGTEGPRGRMKMILSF